MKTEDLKSSVFLISKVGYMIKNKMILYFIFVTDMIYLL